MTLDEIGVVLHNARRQQALHLKDVGAISGLTYAHISEIERGKRPQVRALTLQRLAEALGYEVTVTKVGVSHG